MGEEIEISGVDFVLAILEFMLPVIYLAIPILLFILIYRLFKHTNFLKNLGYFILTLFAFTIVLAIILGIVNAVIN
mgnify:CR=1 FL=1